MVRDRIGGVVFQGSELLHQMLFMKFDRKTPNIDNSKKCLTSIIIIALLIRFSVRKYEN